MNKWMIIAVALVGFISPAFAEQELDQEQQQPQEQLQEQPPPADLHADPPRIWLLGEFELPTRYYYRGYVQERNGFIFQPALKLGVDLWRPEHGLINRVSALVGARASVHSRNTMAVKSPSSLYEVDYVAGLDMQVIERVHIELLYAAITSPNGAFDTIEEINLNMNYSDAGLWPGDAGFALAPFINFKFEIDGSAVGGPEGTLLQTGMEPGFNVSPNFPLRVSFPVEVGISLDNYYFLPQPFAGEDSTYGYTKAGVSVSMPLFFIPPDYGQWLATVGVDYIDLGTNLTTFNRGRDHDVIARLTFRFRY